METPSTLTPMIELSRRQDGSNDTTAFAHDVAEGLSQRQKTLPSRYFYDGAGSKLFQQIMTLPEYYLTRCEQEVLQENKEAMVRQFSQGGLFHLIDLGAGDAFKTKILLSELSEQQSAFDYVPVDISGDAMQELSESLQKELPQVKVEAVVGEYFQALKWLQENKAERKVVLFLGSNIGNFETAESIGFLRSIRSYLQPGDQLLMGVDLRKNPDVILKAYDDAAGVTAAFNLNLLHRINRELDADFDVNQFCHHAIYNPLEGVMRSFLVSKSEQEVHIRKAGLTVHFDAWEALQTENSYKYNIPQIDELGKECGFEIETVFYDSQKRFADVLFKVS
ncbi:L-histidine N(alpha)-methyltransferase [Pontibacter anaerobius]|uniref:L-histidine N(Alpha)-methyltransferase n=1 Tax=Pontibacter anaerobius TaxID=2993940 RepID=A0ABT3RJ39_9BACT|nr:L-histidine N(alpha)-methyltransferase [Pontibacter anaerobius]MCX2741851.1 L-histidine N(alpha)-methyltransferase [Pontibacter anaerobius]